MIFSNKSDFRIYRSSSNDVLLFKSWLFFVIIHREINRINTKVLDTLKLPFTIIISYSRLNFH